jgi:hypothetical protein
MNKIQKKLILVFCGFFFLSILYLPKEMKFHPDGDGQPVSLFMGYRWLWESKGSISFGHLLVEWIGLIVIFIGLFFYFKSSDSNN